MLIISILILLVGMLINYLYYLNNKHLLLAIKMYGGEILIEYGFGLRFVHIYSMFNDQNDSISLKFDLFNLIITFILIFLIVYLIVYIIKKIKG